MPRHCYVVTLPDGGHATMCTSAKLESDPCSVCGRVTPDRGMFLCDWPAKGRGTCSKSLCADHRVQVDRKDYCPSHTDARQGALL